MIHLARPAALLLGLLVVLLLRRRLLAGPLVTTLRILLLLAGLLLLADPWIVAKSTGRDLVLVLDRSRSMPPEGLARAEELHELARESAEAGDRIGLVVFGRDAKVDRPPREDAPWSMPSREVDGDATDLARALDTALAVIPPGRPASLLVVSDGEATGRDPAAVARHALRRGVRVDVVPLRRTGVFDLAVEEVALPPEVTEGEPFPITVWVRSDRETVAPVTVRRGGKEIASGTTRFVRGLNAVRLRDRLVEAGVHVYDVEVAGADDRVPENDRARAAIRVTGPFRVLVVTPAGREDRLTRSLRAAGLGLVVRSPQEAPLLPTTLDGFRAVVLENVPLEDLPPNADANLASWVRDLGGGLLMTGGKASFGPGGYYRSSIERVLPVTMEMRQEQRRFHLAMAIALDRSGSMSVPAGSGTKMDLANLGSCAAVELLGPGDAVAVIAVDSSPHLVVPLMDVENRGGICNRIRKIESMGGGIFVKEAIVAAAQQLRGAQQGTRHIVLFADAADAEEPGDYRTYVPQLKNAGVTISVIGLGSGTDTDAQLLQDIALLGGGRCFFAEDAAALPRVFAQETIQVARSSIVEEPVSVHVEPGIVGIGAWSGAGGGGGFPDVGGYSIAWIAPGAQRGLTTADDQQAPLLSFWQHGLGRSAAYLGIADGELSGSVGTWDGYGDFFTTLVRWLAGTEASGRVFTQVERRGHEAVLTVEVERGRQADLAGLTAQVVGPDGTAQEVTLVRTDETRLEGRFALTGDGVHRPVLQMADGEVLRLPPASLPYSPEYQPRADPAWGEETLKRVARIAEGRVEPAATALWEGERTSRGATSLTSLFAWIALGLLLAEIAVRRLRPRIPIETVTGAIGRAARKLPRPKGWPAWRKAPGTPEDDPASAAETPSAGAPPGSTPPKTRDDDIAAVLERARKRRRGR